MKKNNHSDAILKVNTAAITVLLAITAGIFGPRIMGPKITPAIPEATAQVSDHPRLLTIPAARVNAKIIDVGVTPANNLDVPHNFVDAGWYKYGIKPGQTGSAVLDGHVDNGASIDGVFKHLRDLVPGDDISVTDGAGTVSRFKVVNSAIYGYKDFPSQEIFNQADGRYLKIITCHGTFIPSEDTYDQRLVVTAVLVNS